MFSLDSQIKHVLRPHQILQLSHLFAKHVCFAADRRRMTLKHSAAKHNPLALTLAPKKKRTHNRYYQFHRFALFSIKYCRRLLFSHNFLQ